MNFWADVVFSPSSGSSAVTSTAGSIRPADLFIAQPASGSSNGVTTGGTHPGSSTNSEGARTSSSVTAPRIDPRAVPQAPTMASIRRKGSLAFDFAGY